MSFPRRLRLATLVLAISVVGLVVALGVLRSGGRQVQSLRAREATLYMVTFPAEPIAVEGWKGHYSVPIQTNLPDGTLVDLEYRDDLGEGGGCCESVVAGVVQAPLVNNHCVEKRGTLKGSNVTVQVIVAPDYGFMIHGGPAGLVSPAGFGQPDSVVAVLGTKVENLVRPDVRNEGGIRTLIASSGEYQLPGESCVSPYSH